MSDDVESLWRIINTGLNVMTHDERVAARRLFIRRLRHPEAGANPLATPERYIHPKQGGGSMPRLDSPLCECNDPRSSHDEDGACKACHCPMYTNEDGHA